MDGGHETLLAAAVRVKTVLLSTKVNFLAIRISFNCGVSQVRRRCMLRCSMTVPPFFMRGVTDLSSHIRFDTARAVLGSVSSFTTHHRLYLRILCMYSSLPLAEFLILPPEQRVPGMNTQTCGPLPDIVLGTADYIYSGFKQLLVSPTPWMVPVFSTTLALQPVHILDTSFNWPALRGPHTLLSFLFLYLGRGIQRTKLHFLGSTRSGGRGHRFPDIGRISRDMLLESVTSSNHHCIHRYDCESGCGNCLFFERSTPTLRGDCVFTGCGCSFQ
jgi:hypothetical protein